MTWRTANRGLRRNGIRILVALRVRVLENDDIGAASRLLRRYLRGIRELDLFAQFYGEETL